MKIYPTNRRRFAVLCLVLLVAIIAGFQTHTFPALDTNNIFTGLNTFLGTTSLTQTFFKGPEPWADVTQYGLVGDGVTDNTPAWNTLLALAANPANNIHTVYFPITSVGKYRFASKPNPIGIEMIAVCGNRPVQWNPTGVDAAQLLADYTESTATNAFFDFSGSTSPGNSGVVGCQFWKGTGKTGGTAIKYEGTATTTRAGGGPIEDVRVSGDGTWDWGLRVDCTNITTAGSQGCRDIAVRNLDIFQTTTGCVSLNNAVHLKWVQGGCFPTALVSPNAHVDVTGTSTTNANSTNVEFVGVEILDTLALDWVTNFACSGCYVSSFTSTANAVGSTFDGIVQNGITNTGNIPMMTNKGFFSGGVPSNFTQGDIDASSSSTTGTYKFGSDGQAFIRRDNGGSSAGSEFFFTFDGITTQPFKFDNVNGFTNTLATSSKSYSTATNCASSGGTCASAAAGRVSIAAAATTVTVATTAVTANSEIFIQEDATLGTALSATCNTTTGRLYTVTTRTAGTSFVITASAAPATNPACLSYHIIN